MRHMIIVFGYRQLTSKIATSPFGVWCKFKDPVLSEPQHFVKFQFIMEGDFEKSLCLGNGNILSVSFMFNFNSK